MDYKESIDWLFSQLPMFSRVGAAAYKPGLENVLKLDAFFGYPHKSFKSIHVGGTNGKGSTSHMLAAVLQSQGFKVGLYTSPHLVDFRERIRVNGDMISESGVVDFVNRFRACNYDGKPSFFELTMMMAFDWFKRQKVDYAVIEVGMGGRLDSTNIITPIGTVITNISYDHTQFLGDTLEKIAGEKAGIIKRHIPVVVGESSGNVRKVFFEKAAETDSEIVFADDSNFDTSDLSDIKMPDGVACACGLKGEYQKRNVKTVLCAIDMLRRQGVNISNDSIRTGLNEVVELTGLSGRWMRIGETPLVIADTGHNVAGLSCNLSHLQSIKADNGIKTLRFVIGFVADKDIDHILNLFPKDAKFYLTNAAIPRALPVEILKDKCAQIGIKGEAFKNVRSAFDAAMEDSSPDDLVYVGGSTFIVADLLASLKN